MDWYTHTREMLHQCGWLSVQQLVVYQTVVMVYKILKNQSPSYLHSMFSTSYNYRTRQAGSGIIRSTRTPALDLAACSFRYRASKMYNDLPVYLREKSNLSGFKSATKDWIKKNIPVE